MILVVINVVVLPDTYALRLLSEWFTLVGIARFAATFSLVTPVGLPYFFGKLGSSLKIIIQLFQLQNCLVNGVNAL